MKHITRAISAEMLKLKRTLALWLAIILPLVMVVLQFFIIYRHGIQYLDDGELVWFWIFRQTFNFWTLLGLSLFVTLETALLSNLGGIVFSGMALMVFSTSITSSSFASWSLFAASAVPPV
jgi:hypothetical protein